VASKTDICNMALSHLAHGNTISNIETERSDEATICRLFYDQAVETALRDFPWPFATRIRALNLVEEDPNDEWAYSYQYPSDCLMFRRILSGQRTDTRDTRVPYRTVAGDSGELIYTDAEDAEGEYTRRITDASKFKQDFVNAVSFLLASYIAPRLTAGDPAKLGERAIRFYQFELSKAQANALNEQQPDVEADSEFIRARS
jgi:hypothetical protein